MSSPAVNKKRKIAVFANGWNSENLARYMKGLTEGLDALNEDERGDIHLFLGHDAFGRPDYENKAESCIYKLPKLNEYEGAVLVDPGMDFSDVNKGIIDCIKEAKIPFIRPSQVSDSPLRGWA